MSVIVVVSPKFQSSKWRTLRISTFVTMGLSGLLPIIHAAAIYPWALLNEKAGLGYYLVEGLSLVTGTVFYAVSAGADAMPTLARSPRMGTSPDVPE